MNRPAVALFLVIWLCGCTSITPQRPVLLSPFGDGTQWIVWEDLIFTITLNDGSTDKITVPKGFVTDLVSTPKSVWSKYPPFGKYLMASILHDYLYWEQSCEQDQADKILYQAMRDANSDPLTDSGFYGVLKNVGKFALNKNKADKESGLIKVIPATYLASDSPLERKTVTSWQDYRLALRKLNVQEQLIPVSKSICQALGNEIKVDSIFTAISYRVLAQPPAPPIE